MDRLSGHVDNLAARSERNLAEYSRHIALLLLIPVISCCRGRRGGGDGDRRFWVSVNAAKPEEVQLKRGEISL